MVIKLHYIHEKNIKNFLLSYWPFIFFWCLLFQPGISLSPHLKSPEQQSCVMKLITITALILNIVSVEVEHKTQKQQWNIYELHPVWLTKQIRAKKLHLLWASSKIQMLCLFPSMFHASTHAHTTFTVLPSPHCVPSRSKADIWCHWSGGD